MKKHLIAALAVTLVASTQVKAYDLFITGSTAFRANVAAACSKLYDTGSYHYLDGTTNTGGDAKTYPKAAQWVMNGTVSNTISALGTNTLVIHALFTGSVQGIQTTEQSTPLTYLWPNGTTNANSPTIGFSDASSTVTPYPVSGNFSEEKVAIIPFIFTKSVYSGMNSITNITGGQAQYLIKSGRIPLSSFSGNLADASTYIYNAQRTKDSGTRLCFYKEEGFPYGQGTTVYLFDNVTNNIWYKPSQSTTPGAGVIVGPAGNGNVNKNWGPGYVGGGDIATALNYNVAGNMSMSFLSINDAKNLATGSPNWGQVLAYNGVWPTAAGPGIINNSGTNDFTPIITGKYSLWGYEVVVYPNVDPSSISGDQNLSAAQLGNQLAPGTILGVLDSVSVGTPTVGSIDNEIELSKVPANGPATAVRIGDMHASRAAPGGTITP